MKFYTSVGPNPAVVAMFLAEKGVKLDEVVITANGAKVLGKPNLPGRIAADASALYARNLLDFLKLVFTPEGQFQINLEDDIVAACLMCRDGQVVRKNG